jgi:hypothetical protein
VSDRRWSGSFWPTSTQRALMQVALGPAGQAAGRWQALQPLELTTLETGSFGLLPLLYERLREVAPDDPQLPRLFGTYRSVWYRNQLLLERLGVLLPLLRDRAHVEPLLVGGTSALLRWYPQLGLRPVPQLDLIVGREAAGEAVKVSTYAGWRPAYRTHSSTVLRDESGRVLAIHHGVPAAMVGPLGVDGVSALRERAVELAGVEGVPLALDSGDELLLACATGARTVSVQTCQWLLDVDRALHSAEAPAADVLVERARTVHLVAHVGASVQYLAPIVADEAIAGYAAAFDGERLSRRDRAAFVLAGLGGRRLAGTGQLLASYMRATADQPPLRAALHLPRYLQERWEARSLAKVPIVGAGKVLRALRPRAQDSIPDRNRSASS